MKKKAECKNLLYKKLKIKKKKIKTKNEKKNQV